MIALENPRGDTLTWTIDTDTDLTGWALRWTCKHAWNWQDTLDAAAAATATEGAGLTILSDPAGTLTLEVAASVTALLPTGVYVWDLQATSGTTVRSIVLDTTDSSTHGSLTVTADVSRTTP